MMHGQKNMKLYIIDKLSLAISCVLWLLTNWFFFTYLHLDNTTGMTHLKIMLLLLTVGDRKYGTGVRSDGLIFMPSFVNIL